MINSVYFIIRHKETGQIMPLAKYNKGYSSWEPTVPIHFFSALPIPRLLESKEKAEKCIREWAKGPAKYVSVTSWDGEQDLYVENQKPLVPRKKDDLEVVEIFLNNSVKEQELIERVEREKNSKLLAALEEALRSSALRCRDMSVVGKCGQCNACQLAARLRAAMNNCEFGEGK